MINPSRYRIIAIGKIRKPWIQSGIDLYMKRLPGLLITEIRDSSLRKEAETIRSALKDGELLIPLCEEGERFTSLTFSKKAYNISKGTQRVAENRKPKCLFGRGLQPHTHRSCYKSSLLIVRL